MTDIEYTDLEQAILGWVEESLDLRHGVAGDPDGRLRDWTYNPALGPSAVSAQLIRVTQRSDRVDELLAKATRARARARRSRDEAEFTAEIAFDEATVKNKSRRGFDSYESRDERKADAMLGSLNEKKAAHEAKRLVSVAEEAYDVITQIHWQLDAMRKDLRASLHALQFESSLDR